MYVVWERKMEEQMISKETEKGPITGGQHFLYKED